MSVFLVCVFLVAGTVKGAVGIGLPTAALGIMTMVLDPRTAIALVLLPMLLTNLWQLRRAGEILPACRRYWPFGLALMLGVGVTVSLTRNVSNGFLLAMLGVAILVFVAVNAMVVIPRLPDRWDRAAQLTAGAIGGVLGGLTSVWGPPMAIYLISRRVPKAEFVRASGLLILMGSMPLVIGYLRAGFLTLPLAAASAAMLLPAMAGFSLGERLRHRMSEELFRRILLGIFFLLGLNLLRRAIWGG